MVLQPQEIYLWLTLCSIRGRISSLRLKSSLCKTFIFFRSNNFIWLWGGHLLPEYSTDPRGCDGSDLSEENDVVVCHQQCDDVIIRWVSHDRERPCHFHFVFRSAIVKEDSVVEFFRNEAKPLQDGVFESQLSRTKLFFKSNRQSLPSLWNLKMFLI